MTDPTSAPDPFATTARGRGRRRGSVLVRVAVLVAVLVALTAVGAAAVARRSVDDGRYRTATATLRDVDQVLTTVATVEPVSQASVGFPVAGTVETVEVATGASVATGQTLATLDSDDLLDAVDSAQAQLDQAELTLERALDGEDVSSPSAGGDLATGAEPMSLSSSSSIEPLAVDVELVSDVDRASASSSSTTDLRAAQQAVLDAQSAVSEATRVAETAMASATAACEAAAGPDGDAAALEVCRSALAGALAAQQDLSQAQSDLTEAAQALTDLLATSTAPSEQPGGGAPSGSVVPEGSLPSTDGPSSDSPSGSIPDGSASTPGATMRSPTAEELIAHQKAVDAAALELVVAEQAVEQATIVSPISGIVVAVGLEVGDEVAAGSSTQTVVVAGEGGFEVSTMISVDDLPDIEVGQRARVTPDGGGRALQGEVVRIGVAGTSDGGSTSYPVTIGLTEDGSALGNGSTAAVAITTARAVGATAVPTSAVSVEGDTSTVEVLSDGEVETMEISVGAIGDTWTEVTDGLAPGDVVVLADLDEPLPGTATDGSSAGSAGLPAGGFPGAPAGGG